MSRRYDSRTTIFSPEGRLYQVEYAIEAISNAGAAVGILAKDGVVLAAERKITSKVLSLGAEEVALSHQAVPDMHCQATGQFEAPDMDIRTQMAAKDTYVMGFSLHAVAGHKCCGRPKRKDVQAG